MAAGIFLASIAILAIALTKGNFKDYGDCNPRGEIAEQIPDKYRERDVNISLGEWSGFPPTQICRVSLTRSAAEELEAKGIRVNQPVAEATYPNPADYMWALVPLLLPLGLVWLAGRRPQI